MTSKNDFMERVQSHERGWGNEKYPQRPELMDIISAPVVAFWQAADPKIKHQTITLHTDMSDLEKWLIQAVLRAHVATPDKRLTAIYSGGKKVRVTDVKIVFTVDSE